MKRKPAPKSETASPSYPNRQSAPIESITVPSRRAFLAQIGLTSGALGLGGLPKLAHGQSLAVNFDRLSNHPPLSTVDPAPEAEAAVMDYEEAEEAVDDSDSDEFAAADPVETITENRALWVEPGYLVLLRWTRTATDSGVIASLESSGDAVATFLSGRITNVDHVHNIDQLHQIEHELLTYLGTLLPGVTIEMLHIDHDCTTVCSVLNPSRAYPEIYEVDGEMPGPGWE